jgi:hypothetical protein
LQEAEGSRLETSRLTFAAANAPAASGSQSGALGGGSLSVFVRRREACSFALSKLT